MATKTLLTLEEFYAMPESETGDTFELDRGEVITMPPSPWKHERIKSRITRMLILFLDRQKLGEAYPETGFKLDNESWRRPDVSFVRTERLLGLDDDKPFPGAPDLAVEVVSPSDSRRAVARKLRHLLDSGTLVIWVVYPDSRELNVLTQTSDSWLGAEDII